MFYCEIVENKNTGSLNKKLIDKDDFEPPVVPLER